MPTSVLAGDRVRSMLSRPLPDEEVRELLFTSKAELAHVEGDAWTIEVTPDRLDLLSEGGLALHLQGVLGEAHGIPAIHAPLHPIGLRFDVDPSVTPLRPEIAGAVVHAPPGAPLDPALLAEAVRFQELLHATVGLDRRLASLGIYPLERLEGPISYRRAPFGSLTFTPLDAERPVPVDEFYASHPLAAKYGAYGRQGDTSLVLQDARGRVLSLPPVLNSRDGGEARPGDSVLLIESTGTRAARVREAVGLLTLVFAARGWAVEPVHLRTAAGAMDGSDLLVPRVIPLTTQKLAAVAGAAYPPNQVESWIGRSRLGIRPVAHGYAVLVPPWRPDLLAEVDAIEEVVLARGIRSEDGVLPRGGVRGRHLPEARFRSRANELLLGLGSSQLYTPVLVGRPTAALLGRTGAIELENPVSEELALMRDALQPSLIGSLAHNTRHRYPQRFHEVGPVVVRDPASESGGQTRYRVGALIASEAAGFADAAALVDYLTRSFGAVGVREPVELPGTIPGRSARVRLAGESVGELGEIHPRVLESLGVPVPVAWAEVDLTGLWPLVRRGETP